MVQTLALLSLGALSSPWSPPGSCLSTTTLWGNSMFVGYHREVGLDPQCVPNVAATPTLSVITTNGPTPSTYTATIIPSPTITGIAQLVPSAGQNISTVAYYSPGVCPSGFVYAASFTAGFPEPEKETRYICCPYGFQAQNSTSTRIARQSKGGRRTIRVVTYEYPLCTQTTRTITNLWSLTPGWPSRRPTSYKLTSTQTTNRISRSIFSVTASGVVVAWQETDTAIVEHIRKNNITLPALPDQRKKLSTGAIVGIVFASIFCFFIIAFILSTLLRRARRYRALSKEDDSTEPLAGTSTAYPGAGPSGASTELSNLSSPNPYSPNPYPGNAYAPTPYPSGPVEPWQPGGDARSTAPPQYGDAAAPPKH